MAGVSETVGLSSMNPFANQLGDLLRSRPAGADVARFSFSTFDVVARIQPDCIQHLVDVLVARIRLTDEAGWFNETRIGVLLPYTSAAGAKHLADDVCRMTAADNVNWHYEILTYPSAQHPTRGPSGNGQPLEQDSPEDHYASEPQQATARRRRE